MWKSTEVNNMHKEVFEGKYFTVSQKLVLVAASQESVEQLTEDVVGVCSVISAWIDAVNQEEKNKGNPETMKPRSTEKILSYLQEGKGVVLLQYDGEGKYAPVGFCALPYDLDKEKPGKVLELGSLIKAPTTKQKGIGIAATMATLQLPLAQNAETIIGYANKNSLPLFTLGFNAKLGVGAHIISDDELATCFPYLPAYSGDIIVDLTAIRDALLGNNNQAQAKAFFDKIYKQP